MAIGSRRPGVAGEWAREFSIPRAYDSYQGVIDDPEVDAVYVAAAGADHHAWVAAAAAAHILCESLWPCRCRRRRRWSPRRKAPACSCRKPSWRHHARTRRALEILRAGGIGELRFILAHFTFTIDVEDWRLDAAQGGGAAWDIGCYGVNAARLFAGQEPSDIFARGRFNERRADLSLLVALSFPSGVYAAIDAGFEGPSRGSLELVGTGVSLFLPSAWGPPEEAQLIMQRSTGRDATPEAVTFPPCNHFVEELADFAASVRAGKLLPPAEDGLANMRVLQAALDQCRAHPTTG
ncbi:Gfo/Idh/MocA family oxidoreductase [bacterium]|nr:Gfo/Idh/MocA family oxidoreductase [bacterium]